MRKSRRFCHDFVVRSSAKSVDAIQVTYGAIRRRILVATRVVTLGAYNLKSSKVSKQSTNVSTILETVFDLLDRLTLCALQTRIRVLHASCGILQKCQLLLTTV